MIMMMGTLMTISLSLNEDVKDVKSEMVVSEVVELKMIVKSSSQSQKTMFLLS